jgi:hypothetical protein
VVSFNAMDPSVKSPLNSKFQLPPPNDNNTPSAFQAVPQLPLSSNYLGILSIDVPHVFGDTSANSLDAASLRAHWNENMNRGSLSLFRGLLA